MERERCPWDLGSSCVYTNVCGRRRATLTKRAGKCSVVSTHMFFSQCTLTVLAEKGKKRCPHLPTVEEETKMLDLRDQILVSLPEPRTIWWGVDMIVGCPKGYRGPISHWASSGCMSIFRRTKSDSSGAGERVAGDTAAALGSPYPARAITLQSSPTTHGTGSPRY